MTIRTGLRAGAAMGVLLIATMAQAADVAAAVPADSAADATGIRNTDDIVVTATRVNKETPITSSVFTFEPQSIISRAVIDKAVSPTADFSDVILLTPGASGTSNGNGPGLSESKTVLRGFKDGQFNITYDGVPFGDSNDPTHHSTAYFPSGTYERIIVDRGPGSATDLGQASYGGNIHIISREVTDTRLIEAEGVYGSYNTFLGRGTIQTGASEKLGGLKAVVVGEYKATNGALTGSGAWFVNGFGKLEKPLGSWGKISVLGSYNQDFYRQSDNNGSGCFNGPNASKLTTPAPGEVSQATCDPASQIGQFGKSFALIDNSKLGGTHYSPANQDWNWTHKATDFEIVRFQGKITDKLTFDNKAYTYFYKNFTFSAENTSTYCLTATTTTCTVAAPTNVVGQTTTLNAAGVAVKNIGNIAGYTKVNQYRTSGDIAQINYETSFGTAKVGAWYEHSVSHRYRYDYDITQAFAAGAFTPSGDFDFAAMSKFYNLRQTDKAANVQLNGQPVPLYINYDEHTSWDQIQGFGEFAFKLLDDRLTITPGVKVQDFTRHIDTPIAAQSSRVGIVAQTSYKPTLPYASINFLIQPNFSVYGQFAKGFLVPSLSNSLELATPTASGTIGGALLQPTKTTNYQAGTVYAGNQLNVDFDIYYIKSSNSTFVDPSSGIATQSASSATYKGIEGQVSYAVARGLTAIANGSLNTSKADVTNLWLAQAPNYTALLGAIYSHDRISVSYLHKFIGHQYADTNQLVRISAYSNGIAALGYTVGNFTFGITAYNLFDDRSTTSIGTPTNAGQALYFFQPGRSYEAQARVRF
ncbi:TonB-dependent receptor [Glacieibacterium megasporae]|uniref:TonB-dependent receptor n=1 Tax=Glacieibacterium megasporae TaxID=2835787 RepID=UPI001C1E854C|nr:TonB-dependent receptor [Polymorphobacter megasporae]UAJ08731.1 TonB-dependent receptor [Polymorphobacter megasporae]